MNANDVFGGRQPDLLALLFQITRQASPVQQPAKSVFGLVSPRIVNVNSRGLYKCNPKSVMNEQPYQQLGESLTIIPSITDHSHISPRKEVETSK